MKNLLIRNSEYGAYIAVGDWNAVEGQKLADELGAYATPLNSDFAASIH